MLDWKLPGIQYDATGSPTAVKMSSPVYIKITPKLCEMNDKGDVRSDGVWGFGV